MYYSFEIILNINVSQLNSRECTSNIPGRDNHPARRIINSTPERHPREKLPLGEATPRSPPRLGDDGTESAEDADKYGNRREINHRSII